MSKKPILKGYKRIGTKFIPPILQMGPVTNISYVNQILPELIWMGLLNDRYGYKKGISLVEQITTRAFENRACENHINFALCSNFSLLPVTSKQALLEDMEIEKIRPLLSEAIAPLHLLYDDFPMSFLCNEQRAMDTSELLRQMAACVALHFDRFDVPACVIQANVLYVREINGGIAYAEGLRPDFNAILGDPDSRETQSAMAKARMGAMMEFDQPTSVVETDWSESFWDQGYKISRCIFEEDARNDSEKD